MRNLVLDPRRQITQRRLVQRHRRTQGPYRRLHPHLQRNRASLRLDKIRSLAETPQTMFREPVIPGTSNSPRAETPAEGSPPHKQVSPAVSADWPNDGP